MIAKQLNSIVWALRGCWGQYRLPSLECIRVTSDGFSLVFQATNLVTRIKARVEAQVDPFDVLVEGNDLQAVARMFGSGPGEVNVTEDNGVLTFANMLLAVVLGGRDTLDFPGLSKSKFTIARFIVDADRLGGVVLGAAKDDSRIVLNTVKLGSNGKMIAANGWLLTIADLESVESKQDVLIPVRTACKIAQVLKGPVQVEKGGLFARITGESRVTGVDITMYSTLVNGCFPDVNPIVKTAKKNASDHPVSISVSALRGAMAEAAVLGRQRKDGNLSTMIEPIKDALLVTAAMGAGSVTFNIGCDSAAAEYPEKRLGAGFMETVLKGFAKAGIGTVEMNIGVESTSVVTFNEIGGSMTSLLMPLHIGTTRPDSERFFGLSRDVFIK